MKFFPFLGLIALAILAARYFYGGRLMTVSAGHSATARNVADIQDIVVDLKVDSEILLFILVSADRSINRISSGTFGNNNRDMFIGMTPDPAIFQRVWSHLTDSILQGLSMRFQMSENPLGAPCKLTLMFQFNDGKSASSEYLYGTQSEGPPKEVRDFVRAAVRETDSWYQEQLKMVEKLGP
jgi:hypothetical protein